jgi:hypothetical protein
LFKGYHGTIFCYGEFLFTVTNKLSGQTGTGKTHTLCCKTPGMEGIIPRSVMSIFETIEQDMEREYKVQMSYVQIYMEMVRKYFFH